MSLKGKRIAVTGAFGSLGAAVARAALAAGARVAAIDRGPSAEAPLAANDMLLIGKVDLAYPVDAKRALDTAASELGGLDALINVAGTFRWETVATGSIDTWDELYRTNLRTAVLASQAALPHLFKQEGGRIVNVGASAAAKAGAGMGAYAASKAGVAKLTESLAEELKDQGVAVNAVLPSIIDTPANRADMPDAEFSRWVTPEALADVVIFLLSPESSAITGALIPVTGRV